MRSIKTLLIILSISPALFSQEQTDLGTFKTPKYFTQGHDLHVSDDAIILNYSPYIPVTNLSLVKYGFYQHAPINSGVEFTEKRIPTEDGIIQQCHYSGDTITEFVIYYKKGFPKYKCTYVIRTRSCKTMEIFGEQKTLAEHEFSDPASYDNIRLVRAGDHYAFIEMTDTKGTVTFLTDQFQEINKINLNSPTFNSIECKECYFAIPNEDGSILIGFSDLTLGPLNKVKNKILRLTDEGESFWYETTLKDTESSLASHGSYYYNVSKKELIWTFFSRSKEKYGYGIVKWNSNGMNISTQVTTLGFEDIFKNEPQIMSYYRANKLSTTDLWGRLDYLGSIQFINNGNEEYIIIQKPHITYELVSATYVINVNESGQLKWIKPILSEVRDPMNFTSAKPFIKNGKLHFFVADYSTNSKKNEHLNLSFRKEGGTISFFDLALDPTDGSETINQKYNFTTEAGVKITDMLIDQKKLEIVIELEKEKQVEYKRLKI